MADNELTPWQRLVLAFWALFAVLLHAEVAAQVLRLREQRRTAPGLPPGGAGEGATARRAEPAWTDRREAPAAAEPKAPEGNGGAAPARAASTTSPAAPAPERPAGARAVPDQRAALQVIAILQREGRLVDFVEEDLAGFPDAAIGAAARTVHAGCKKAIQEMFQLEPVYRESEGAQVTVAAGFDPSAIRLTGNVIGKPPFKGALRHHGWRAREVKLPSTDGMDPAILAPAEVEL